ncbi:hypothetical protein SAMD00019534_072220 [Acytostelium subglobosum LB1]|uniref:hypothetical protein n=1 Tax=Acytostelium subglobosum LB1 TaxID=1410327 RepID=UPI00064490C9|nr:hypothetical protein SAMD00019534_072220 [Acytostelium subglobosum LB1]GAM24047.1 hypothetical protein SAMD00019534_072220 [Acytostelium subglobosum LB1]|eukprot:XP_012753083.1 hypothetical protein SAMD00019534_072220 [Acytostelium subglobosum LB1]
MLGVLEKALAPCKKGAMFLCKGETELPMPRIEVKDVGLLSYPVPPVQIQSMIERATRAPYGKGTETITDLNVRRVWQIQNTDINITGKPFQTFFTSITNSIKESMGLTNDTVTAELYKLLVYDKGSFFLPHRDSEKADNMFGTLVLSLPCPHRGGDLVVNHSGRDEVVSLENDSMSTIKWTAFFADCQHEVKPVTEGNRVCLVYNLLRSGGTKVEINAAYEPITKAFNQVFGIGHDEVNDDDTVDDENTATLDEDQKSDDESDDEDNDDVQSDVKITKKARTSLTTNTTTQVDVQEEDDDNDNENNEDEDVDVDNDEDDDDDDNVYEDKDQDDNDEEDMNSKGNHIPEKLVYSLEHVYSKSNFTLESLKGSDATLARTLQAFANESHIKLGLAFIQIREAGPCESPGYCNEKHISSRTSIILKDVKDMETGSIISEEIRLRTKEIMPRGCINKLKPYFEETREATGNEGGSFERLYRQSAIVIWSTLSTGKFTMVESVDVVFEILENELTKLGSIDANPKATQELFIQMIRSLDSHPKKPDHITKILQLLSTIKDGQYLPKILQTLLETTGVLYCTEMHQNAFLELFLRTPSMTYESMDEILKTFSNAVLEGSLLGMLDKLLEMFAPETSIHHDKCTLLPKHLQDKISSLASHLLIPKFIPIPNTRYNVVQPNQSFSTTISMVDTMSKQLKDGTALFFVNDTLLSQMYTNAFKIIIDNRSYFDYSMILPMLPVIEQLNVAHPEWLADDENKYYQSYLKKLIDYKLENSNETISNNLYSIWRAVHAEDSIIKAFIAKICIKVIRIRKILTRLLGLLHNEFADSPHYATLWDQVAKSILKQAKTKPDTTDNKFDIAVDCDCDDCGGIKKFLISNETKLNLYVSKWDCSLDHVIEMTEDLPLERKATRYPYCSLELTKTEEGKQELLDMYNQAVNICHSLVKIPPSNISNLDNAGDLDAMNAIVNSTPAPQVYPHDMPPKTPPMVLDEPMEDDDNDDDQEP